MAMFTTPMGKSYLCPSPPVVNLYESKTGKPSVVVRFTNLQLQAFQIELGKFASGNHASINECINLFVLFLFLFLFVVVVYLISFCFYIQASRCSQVSFGSGVQAPLYLSLEQDDSVPVVVGTLTVIVSILVIVGYAVYKSWVFKQVDYDNMI